MRRVFGLRFLVEAAFIALVAALVWYEDVAKPWILAAIAGAWLLVALGEWLLSRRERELPRDASPGARHVPGTEPAEVDTPRPAPAPALELTPEPEAEPEPVPLAPSLGVRHVPDTESAEVDTPPAAERVVQLPARTEPCEWNLWELERVARDAAGADAVRDEERSFLLMYLREFADPDGMLSVTFDPLVRETFAEVLGAVRP